MQKVAFGACGCSKLWRPPRKPGFLHSCLGPSVLCGMPVARNLYMNWACSKQLTWGKGTYVNLLWQLKRQTLKGCFTGRILTVMCWEKINVFNSPGSQSTLQKSIPLHSGKVSGKVSGTQKAKHVEFEKAITSGCFCWDAHLSSSGGEIPPVLGSRGSGSVGDAQPHGAAGWGVPWVCVCTQLCSPGGSGWEAWPARPDPRSCSLQDSGHSLVEKEAHAPSPSRIPPGDAAMSHAPQGSGGKDPWLPCPLGVRSCGAQERVGAAKTCGAPMQAVSREDASRWCSSPRCLALWFAKVITESYHLVRESALLPLPSGLESGALHTRWFRGWGQWVRTGWILGTSYQILMVNG